MIIYYIMLYIPTNNNQLTETLEAEAEPAIELRGARSR
jgi:hypothetical protein